MNKSIGYTELYFDGEKISYTISALFCEDGTYEMPSLEFTKNKGHIGEESVECWDNPDYLKTLYTDVIKPWVEETKIVNAERFAELLKVEGVSLTDFKELYELFNNAFKFMLL